MNAVETDVIVVGAGPSGLSVAAGAALNGFRTTVLDRRAAGSNPARAAVVHARTLEVLERLGVTERLVARGLRARRFRRRDRDCVLVSLRFDELPTPDPSGWMLSQAETEAALSARLTEIGTRVQWEREVIDVTQTQDFVIAMLSNGVRVRGRYLVAADGTHSTIRERLNLPFESERRRELRTWRSGRVLLAGDTPHTQSPAGGQDMNACIQGGVALADALARTLRTRDDRPLDEYAETRGDVRAVRARRSTS